MMISVVRQLCWRKLHGSPKLGIAVGKLETARHHANHIVLFVVEPKLLADDLRIAAKPAQEKSLAQDHHARRSRHIVGSAEVAAKSRASAENGEKIRGDEISGNLFGVSFTGKVERTTESRRGHIFKHLVARFPVSEISGRRRIARKAVGRGVFPDHYEAIRLAVRERADEHRVRDAEDRRIRRDAQRQHGHYEKCEAGIFRHHAKTVANILK